MKTLPCLDVPCLVVPCLDVPYLDVPCLDVSSPQLPSPMFCVAGASFISQSANPQDRGAMVLRRIPDESIGESKCTDHPSPGKLRIVARGI